jgi:hypothetical protein
MATKAVKSVKTTVAQKSYGKGHGKGEVPAASGKGMNPSAQRDHAKMTVPQQQLGLAQQVPQGPAAPVPQQVPQPFSMPNDDSQESL